MGYRTQQIRVDGGTIIRPHSATFEIAVDNPITIKQFGLIHRASKVKVEEILDGPEAGELIVTVVRSLKRNCDEALPFIQGPVVQPGASQ